MWSPPTIILHIFLILSLNCTRSFSSYISLKYLDNLHYFLGIKVKHYSFGILFTQTKYACGLLAKAQMVEPTKN